MPQTFEDCVDLLIPEMQRRGLFWDDYFAPGATYRENLYEVRGQSNPPGDHSAGKMIWSPEYDPMACSKSVNGAVNGGRNGDVEESLDPVSMQLG